MLALDWAHTRDFACFDGEQGFMLPFPQILELAKKQDRVAIEQGAPLTFLYRLVRP